MDAGKGTPTTPEELRAAAASPLALADTEYVRALLLLAAQGLEQAQFAATLNRDTVKAQQREYTRMIARLNGRLSPLLRRFQQQLGIRKAHRK